LRIHIASLAAIVAASACASAPTAGPLTEGFDGTSRIVSIDSARPPASVTVQLEEPAHVAVLLVIPGHSATLLFPRDSVTDTQRPAGQSTIAVEIPGMLVRRDSAGGIRPRQTSGAAQDSMRRRRTVSSATMRGPGPVPLDAPAFMLLLTSTRPYEYHRVIDRTAGVSIPSIKEEALNAVAKAVRATLPEPRRLTGYYQLVELAPKR
jgi:hypothetical protein